MNEAGSLKHCLEETTVKPHESRECGVRTCTVLSHYNLGVVTAASIITFTNTLSSWLQLRYQI